MVVIIIAFLPTLIWLIWYFQQPAPSLGIGWIGQPKFADTVATGWNLLSGYAGKFSFPSVIFGIVATIFVLFGIIHGFTQIKNKRYSSLLILVGLVLSIFTVWVISQRRPIYMDRYFIVVIPGIAYLVATGASYLFNRLSVSSLPVPRPFLMLFGGILILLIGLWQAWQVRVDVKYLREDWRSLSLVLKNDSAETPTIWFSDPEAEVPFRYYFGTSYHLIQQIEPPVCKSVCWWILRQPYTSTHAFAQGIHDPDHRWLPEIPSGCAIQDIWGSPSGLESWKVKCST